MEKAKRLGVRSVSERKRRTGGGSLVRGKWNRTKGNESKENSIISFSLKNKKYPKFALCLGSGKYLVSLHKGTIYRVIPDEEAEELGMLRIIDDTNEDYLFEKSLFELVSLSPKLERELKKAYQSI